MDFKAPPREAERPAAEEEKASLPPADASTSTPNVSKEDFRAIYAERMRQAAAEAAIRRMATASATAAACTEAPTAVAAASSAVPDAATAAAAASGPSSTATTSSTAEDARRRELMERIVASRMLLQQRHAQATANAAQSATAGGGATIVQNPVGAVPVTPPTPPPAPQAPAAAAAPAAPVDDDMFFADNQQRQQLREDNAAREGGAVRALGARLGFLARGGGANGNNGQGGEWWDNLGEDFFHQYIMHPLLCVLVLPFPAYVTIACVIAAKVGMRLMQNARIRVVHRDGAAAAAGAGQQQQQGGGAVRGMADINNAGAADPAAANAQQPEGAAAAAEGQSAPAVPVPPRQRGRASRFFYCLFKAIITFFVSMFPLFTIEGLRRELERDGMLAPEGANANPANAAVDGAAAAENVAENAQ